MNRAYTLLCVVALLLPASWGAYGQDAPPLPEGLAGEPSRKVSEPDLPAGLAPPTAAKEEGPPLPDGLEATASSEGPQLPAGLAGEEAAPGPALPAGLAGAADTAAAPLGETQPDELPFDLKGFWEVRGGIRTQSDRYEKDASLGETRLQLEIEKDWPSVKAQMRADFIYDPVLDHHEILLDSGQGWLDLRTAFLAFSPLDFADAKVGRQILTWGVGDLLFINDLFPKDWNAFFIGRGVEYLKAPSDALKVSFFSSLANLDIVYTPSFNPDRYVDSRRLSYFNPSLQRLAGRDAVGAVDRPDTYFSDDELAARLYATVHGYELAGYAYRGFWKSPAGMNPVSGAATFPALEVYGASARGAVGKGIGSAEFGYCRSDDDTGGSDPLIQNSQLRWLLGYEQEVARDFTVGGQYYIEHMLDHAAYARTLPSGVQGTREDHHILTLRLTKLLLDQNLRLSLFTFYSPSDKDCYMRPVATYKIDDNQSVEAGANVFFGAYDYTFLGQFERDSNIYVAYRYSF